MRVPGTLGTRVARRILGLFLVCALLPVALVLALSYTQVQRTVGEQQLSQLTRAADQYGGNVLEIRSSPRAASSLLSWGDS